jgi:hypothetical protein
VSISTIKLWVKCTAIYGGGCYVTLHWSQSANNWGATLSGDAADYGSTDDNVEGSVNVNATGWWSWTITASSLNMAQTLYVRLRATTENVGAGTNYFITFASQNNATAGDRPYLEIVEAAAGGPPLRTLMGVGI